MMIRKKLLLLLFISISLFNHSFAQPPGSINNWNLVFEDNFNGGSLDKTKWGYNYPWGRTHNHRAYMTDSMVTVQNGYLNIKAINKRHPEAPAGTNQYESSFGYLSFDYTSGAIHSKGKFEITYGYIEGRFKVPALQGTWPAFWTLNADGAWPPEIDILEIPDDKKVHHYYYHYGPDWQNEKSFGTTHSGPDKSQGFHTYGVEWGPTYMKFYFDGQLLNSYTNRPEAAQGKNMYMLINLAIDGWAPTPPANALWPAIYQCDWIRVWKPNESANFDFENGSLSPWGPWNNATITSDCKRSGNYGVKLSGSPVSIERTVTLEPNTRYVFGGYGKVNSSGETAMFGVKNFGGNQIVKTLNSTSFVKDSVVFTTGTTNTSAIVFWYKSSGSGSACGDDFFLYKAPKTAPTVSITDPTNNTILNATESITINALSKDADGTVSKVAFYNGQTLLGLDDSSPYNFVWRNLKPGTYELTAVATDNDGNITTSSPVKIIINNHPVVSLTSPLTQTTFSAPAKVNITALATDSDGLVTSVSFYSGQTQIGTSSSSPYSISYEFKDDGIFSIHAIAKDNNGGADTSETVTIYVSTVSSINAENKKMITALPNPFSHKTSISIPAGEKILQIKLLNLDGKELKNLSSIIDNEITLGEDLQMGIYYLIVVTENGCYTKSLMKR